METLGDKQRRFALRFAQLVLWLYDQGLACTYGEGLRSDEQAEINAMGPNGRAALCRFLEPAFAALANLIRNNTGSGIRKTLHELKLAHDLNLFRRLPSGGWQWLSQGDEPEWTLVGRRWECMGADHCWGGRFVDASGKPKPDANHFSILHEGRK